MLCPVCADAVQLQDVHKWSFGRPDPKAVKANDPEGPNEDIPLEGLDNGIAEQELDASNDRSVNWHVTLQANAGF